MIASDTDDLGEEQKVRAGARSAWVGALLLALLAAAACGGETPTRSPGDDGPVEVWIVPALDTATVGDRLEFRFATRGGDPRPEWSSTDPEVASVSPLGSTAEAFVRAPGEVGVVARQAGLSDTARLVALPVERVEIVAGTDSVDVDDTLTLDAVVRDALGGTTSDSVAWESLDPAVLDVAPTGPQSAEVVPLAAGSGEVLARDGRGHADTATVVAADFSPDLAVRELELLPRGILADSLATAWLVVTQGRGVLDDVPGYRWEVARGGEVLASGEVTETAPRSTDTLVVEGLGPFRPGVHRLTARVDADDRIEEIDETDNVGEARLVSRSPGFDIEVVWTMSPDSLDPAIVEGIERGVANWEGIVRGDLPDVRRDSIPLQECTVQETNIPPRTEPVDDFVVVVNIVGSSAVLLGKPCLHREAVGGRPAMPYAGMVQFDTINISRDPDQLSNGMDHELAHALGFDGDMFTRDGIDAVQFRDGGAIYTGPMGVRAYRRGGGEGNHVPMANASHWPDRWDTQLGGGTELTTLEAAPMADLFYAVDLSAVRPFDLGAEPSARSGAR